MEAGKVKTQAGFVTTMPSFEDAELMGLLEEHKVTVHAETTDGWGRILINEEVQSLVGNVEDNAEGLLNKNRSKLEALADALLREETLEPDEVRQILEGAEQARSVSAM